MVALVLLNVFLSEIKSKNNLEIKNNQCKEKKYTMEDQFSVLGSNFIHFLAEIWLTRFTKHPYCECNAAAI